MDRVDTTSDQIKLATMIRRPYVEVQFENGATLNTMIVTFLSSNTPKNLFYSHLVVKI